MKVVFVTHALFPEAGGVYKVLRNVPQEIVRMGHEVVIIAHDRRVWPSIHTEQADDIPVYRLPLTGRSFPLSFLPFLRIISRLHPDVINVHFPASGHSLHSFSAARLLGIPLVVSIHHYELTHPYLPARLLARFVTRQADVITACSQWVWDTTSKKANIRARCFFPIRNGTHIPNLRGIYRSARTSNYIAAAGRFSPEKGFDILIRAFDAVKSVVPDVQLVIAGDGPQRQQLRELIERLAIGDRVSLIGHVAHEEVVRLFAGSVFVVVPSHAEPLGIVNLEAMASGKLVISTASGGIPEIVQDGVNGILVPPDDPGSLAAAMRSCLLDRQYCDEMGKQAREHVQQHHTWYIAARLYLDAFEAAVTKHGRGHDCCDEGD